MPQLENDPLESNCLAFLAMFRARSHRALYRAQYVAPLAEELGFSLEEALRFARELERLGFLRELSGMGLQGPLMEITREGIETVQTRYGQSS